MKKRWVLLLVIFLIIVTGAVLCLSRGKSLQVINNSFSAPSPAPVSQITVMLAGDIMLGRTVNSYSVDTKKDPLFPFRKVKDLLNTEDLVFANLENPIINNCPRHSGGYTFCAEPVMADGLAFAGIDIVTLANNHTNNYGKGGIEETKQILAEKGIEYVGLGNLIIKEVQGVKFGFLGFDYVDNKPTAVDFKLIETAKSQVDILIVGIHWGVEYTPEPTHEQRELAKQIVAAGADVIAGHHPHWVQSHEEVNGKPVYYSMGNFVFDQMWSEETKKGILVKMVFEGKKLKNQEIIDTYIRERGQPEILNSAVPVGRQD